MTGTFAHRAANVVDLGVSGLDAPIGVTANHPFWSQDRQDFVAAGELRVDERLLGLTDQAVVTSITPRAGPEAVTTWR